VISNRTAPQPQPPASSAGAPSIASYGSAPVQ
jgi:hypothetical protein